MHFSTFNQHLPTVQAVSLNLYAALVYRFTDAILWRKDVFGAFFENANNVIMQAKEAERRYNQRLRRL